MNTTRFVGGRRDGKESEPTLTLPNMTFLYPDGVNEHYRRQPDGSYLHFRTDMPPQPEKVVSVMDLPAHLDALPSVQGGPGRTFVLELPEDLDDDVTEEEVAALRTRLEERLGGARVIILSPGCKLKSASPYYVRQRQGDYELELGFVTLEEQSAYLRSIEHKIADPKQTMSAPFANMSGSPSTVPPGFFSGIDSPVIEPKCAELVEGVDYNCGLGPDDEPLPATSGPPLIPLDAAFTLCLDRVVPIPESPSGPEPSTVPARFVGGPFDGRQWGIRVTANGLLAEYVQVMHWHGKQCMPAVYRVGVEGGKAVARFACMSLLEDDVQMINPDEMEPLPSLLAIDAAFALVLYRLVSDKLTPTPESSSGPEGLREAISSFRDFFARCKVQETEDEANPLLADYWRVTVEKICEHRKWLYLNNVYPGSDKDPGPLQTRPLPASEPPAVVGGGYFFASEFGVEDAKKLLAALGDVQCKCGHVLGAHDRRGAEFGGACPALGCGCRVFRAMPAAPAPKAEPVPEPHPDLARGLEMATEQVRQDCQDFVSRTQMAAKAVAPQSAPESHPDHGLRTLSAQDCQDFADFCKERGWLAPGLDRPRAHYELKPPTTPEPAPEPEPKIKFREFL